MVESVVLKKEVRSDFMQILSLDSKSKALCNQETLYSTNILNIS